jgi:hypothetical protein
MLKICRVDNRVISGSYFEFDLSKNMDASQDLSRSGNINCYGRKKRLTTGILYLSLDPTLCRSIIGGSNQEEDLLHTRLNPQYLFHKRCTEIKHQRVSHTTSTKLYHSALTS